MVFSDPITFTPLNPLNKEYLKTTIPYDGKSMSVTTLSSEDVITRAYGVNPDAMYGGAFRLSIIKNETNIFAGQNVYIEKVIYNDPATIVFWSDGTKTVSKCNKDSFPYDSYNREFGLMLCVLKKVFGKEATRELLSDWCHLVSSLGTLDTCKTITIKDVRKAHKEEG